MNPRTHIDRAVRCAMIAGALCLSPRSAGAQPTSDKDRAIALANQGYEELAAGRVEEAARLFAQAEATHHAPTFLVYLAQAEVTLGKLASARRHYAAAAEEALEPGASDAFRKAQETARTELAALEPRVPRVEIAVAGVDARAARLTIDAVPVPAARTLDRQLVDPGTHVFIVSAAGRAPISQTVTLAEGDRVRLDFPFAPATAPSRSAPVAAAAPPVGSRRSLVPAGIAFGVGAAGLAVGTVVGLVALGKADAIKERCPDLECDAGELNTQQDEADSAHGLAKVSDAAFIVGGVGVAVGVVLLLAIPGTSTTASVGPRSLALRGSF